MEPAGLDKWKKVRGTLVLCLAGCMVVSGAFSFFQWRWAGFLTTEAAALCLALGFWITEMLIGVFTRVKNANPTAIALLFFGKLLWWALLFWGARHLPSGLDGAVAIGIGTFLFSLLIATVRHYGMPRISDGNPPPAP